MTWTYSLALTADRDKVRVYIGDTDEDNQLLQDEEIDLILDDTGSVEAAAVRAARVLAAKYAKFVDQTVGRVSYKFSQKSKGFMALAEMLENSLLGAGGEPYAGGISEDDKEAHTDNTDNTEAFFYRELLDE